MPVSEIKATVISTTQVLSDAPHGLICTYRFDIQLLQVSRHAWPLDTRTDMLIYPSSCIPKALRMSLSQAYLAVLWRQRIHSRILPHQKLGKTQRTLICLIFSLSFVNSLQLLQNLYRIRIEIPHGCTEISDFLWQCNSGTARWKNLVPGSYCRASQELLNGGWIMGIGPRNLSYPLFAQGTFSSACR